MKSKLVAVLGVVVGLVMCSVPMFGHHSTAMYDEEHPVTLTGTVKEFKLFNPHMQIHFDVKDENGNVVPWVGTGTSGLKLSRMHGWTKNTLKPGDEITVTGFPLKDSNKTMLIQKLVGPDGLEYSGSGNGPGTSPPR